ncbi:MAG TPA: hypothetical protein VH186_04280 [Chloroflexia bacterium]|nr:hypothetical protein [Chloroflexia bacterium]
MIRDVLFIHCNEFEEVVEIESYAERNGAIVSQKKSESGDKRPFDRMRSQLEAEGWQIELAGTVRIGQHQAEAKSYVARRPRS